MIYHHLSHALRIMRTEPDPMKWAQMIDALTTEQQAEVRPWLREQFKRVQRHRQATSTTPPPALPTASSPRRRR